MITDVLHVVGYVCGMRLKVKELVDSEYFQRGILFAILVNTLSMGIEYHNQVSEEHSNLICTSDMITNSSCSTMLR